VCIIQNGLVKGYEESDFEQVFGTWTVNNESIVTKDSNALLKCEAVNDEDEHVVQVVFNDISLGDQIRVISNYRTNADYWYGELEFGLYGDGRTKVTFRIVRVEGGAHTQVEDDVSLPIDVLPGPTAIIEVAFSKNVVCLNYGSGGTKTFHYHNNSLTDNWGGVGTGNITGPVTFTDFKLLYHGVRREGCPGCFIPFDPPTCLKIVINGLTEGPDCFQVPCGCYNDTYYLQGAFAEIPGAVAPLPVRWYKSSNSTGYYPQWCNEFQEARYYKDGDNYYFEIKINPIEDFPLPVTYTIFRVLVGDEANDIIDVENLNVPLIENNGACDASGATCVVTAVDGDDCPGSDLECPACSNCGQTKPEEYSMIMNGWPATGSFINAHLINGVELIAQQYVTTLGPCYWGTPLFYYDPDSGFNFRYFVMSIHFKWVHLEGGGTEVTINVSYGINDGFGVFTKTVTETINGPIDCRFERTFDMGVGRTIAVKSL